MSANPDRLYQLLPVIYQIRDAEQGYPLRALLQVISEQVNIVEADISQLYENWFIETCQNWVVPYLGSLIGYTPLTNLNDFASPSTAQGIAEEGMLIPRQEVANTIGYRRRKGTLSLLTDLATSVGGWRSYAVEFYQLLGVTQNINYPQLKRGGTANIRNGWAMEWINGPFDRTSKNCEVRRIVSKHRKGRTNIPEVGIFVWRLNAYSVTQTPAYCCEEIAPNFYTFSVLGNDTQLFTNAQPTTVSPSYNANELEYPGPIRRRSFVSIEPAENDSSTPGVPFYYGDGRSLEIFLGSTRQPVPADQIIPADLTNWAYRPLPNTVAVDPKLGRIAFPAGSLRKQGVWVSYYYGFSAPIGGGEYSRTLSEPADASFYLVGQGETFAHINEALTQWKADKPTSAIIEITDSGAYVEPIDISLAANQTLEIRAANRKRPVIRLLDWQTSAPNDLHVSGEAGSCFILDGLLVAGRGVQIEAKVASVTIRHCTLVPGWGLQCDCEPKRPTEPSLELIDAPACLSVEHSILGGIQVDRDEAAEDPTIIRISDCIVDATSNERIALGAPASLCAYTNLTIVRSTVIGQVQTHALSLAENCIFTGIVLACRRQGGCVRFCYVPSGSRTPRRFECQPDLVDAAVAALFNTGDIDAAQQATLQTSERFRVTPEFNNTRYGSATYCQLATTCACEIKSGASDESEMGVFHDLYQPQRLSNLKTRLSEYSPAGMDAGIIFVT